MEETLEPVETVTQEPVVTDTYTKEIDLPSNGYLGGPKKVTLRAMKATEEKILYSSRDFSFIKKLCKACIVSPKNIDTSKLLPQDYFFMLFQIREMTFGPTYKQPVRCPHCGMHQDAEINITDFEYSLLEEDVNSKLFIELPISKANVYLKLLSQDKIDAVDKECVTLFKEGKLSDPDGTAMMRKTALCIDSITDLEFKDEDHKLSYVNKLHYADFNAIRNKLNSITNSFGVKNNTTVTCSNKNCGESIEVTGTICPEFFHPNY